MLDLRGSGVVRVLAVVLFPHRSHGGLVVPSRRQHSGLIVVLLRGREAVVAEQGCGHADMFRVLDGNAGRGAVPEEVGCYGLTDGVFGAVLDLMADRLVSERVTESGDPEVI